MLMVYSLVILVDMKSSSHPFQATLCECTEGIITLQENKLSLLTKTSHHDLYSHCTVSKYIGGGDV